VVLTPAGRSALEAAAPSHVDAVRDAVFDRLTAEQAERLREACDVIVAGLSEDAGCGEAPDGARQSQDDVCLEA
jgi:hypothetical protein